MDTISQSQLDELTARVKELPEIDDAIAVACPPKPVLPAPAGEGEGGDLLFERVWRVQPSVQAAVAEDGTWLLVSDDPSIRDVLSSVAPSLIHVAADADVKALMREHPALQAVIMHTGDATRVLVALQALASTRIPLLVLTCTGVWAVEGDQIDLQYATIPGLVRTAVAEQAIPWIRQVDVLKHQPETWGAAIRDELRCADGESVVAYRDGLRLVPRLRPVEAGQGAAPGIVPGGTYLITGGLGGIGRVLSEFLVAAYGARLVIIGRTPDAATLSALKTLGEAEYFAGDAADMSLLRAAVEDAERRWSQPLAGVFHLACADMSDHWVNAARHTLLNERADTFREIYRAKVTGTLAIADVLAESPGTNVICFSSADAEFGSRSFGAYSAANSFLNGFADYWTRCQGRSAYSLSWSMWAGIGMSRDMSNSVTAEARGLRALSPEAGLAALAGALGLRHPNLLIGLNPQNAYVQRQMVPGQAGTAEVLVAYTAASEVDTDRLSSAVGCSVPVRFLRFNSLPAEPRALLTAVPSSDRRYVEPATEFEEQLASIWSDVLNQPRVGRHDSFFEMGGNSMRAVQLVARISATFDTEVSVQQLYGNPTIGALADELAVSNSPRLGGRPCTT